MLSVPGTSPGADGKLSAFAASVHSSLLVGRQPLPASLQEVSDSTRHGWLGFYSGLREVVSDMGGGMRRAVLEDSLGAAVPALTGSLCPSWAEHGPAGRVGGGGQTGCLSRAQQAHSFQA